MVKYKLSPSALNIYRECPRCFWLQVNKNIRRPRGIFPSLPGGMDLVIKTYFDKFRLKDALPPELEGRVDGKLFRDIKTLAKWRSWKNTDLCYKDESLKAVLSGALDDCLVYNDYYIPLDYKTRGSELKEDPRKYYQLQLDCYSLILDSCGYKNNGLAYLVYYWPLEVIEKGVVKFHVEPIKIEVSIDSAKKVFRKAVISLSSPIPNASSVCEYCNSNFYTT